MCICVPKTLLQLVQTEHPTFTQLISFIQFTEALKIIPPLKCQGTQVLCLSPRVRPSALKGTAGADGGKLRIVSLSRAASFLSSLETTLFVILSRDWDDTYDIQQSGDYL